MTEANGAAPYRCTGCDRRFDEWGKLREHHRVCLKFIERADGEERTHETQSAHAMSGFMRHDANWEPDA